MDSPSEHLIVFTRYPEPGRAKTRLIPALGPEGAAYLQRQMTEHAFTQIRQLKLQHPVSVEVRYDGGDNSLFQQWLGNGITYLPQGKGDLGQRMECAFREAFASGVQRAVLIGTDCPGISPTIIQKAFDALQDKDLTIGPASDGGYYLVGLNNPVPQLFAGISWGTERVRVQSLKIAEELGLKNSLLDVLDDVDNPQDISVWQNTAWYLKPHESVPEISIIIPTLNEAANIGKTLGHLVNTVGVEVSVVDGGSDDNTVSLARSFGVKVFSNVPGGRAGQMNAGALLASGKTLLFLHADTLLPSGFDQEVQRIFNCPENVVGAFSLSIDSSLSGIGLIAKVAKWRSRYLKLPYGDQAIFLRTELFHQLGGFADMPIMEDFELVRRLKRYGKIKISPLSVVTSGRRWRKYGVWKTTIINQLVVLAYYLGVNTNKIADWYRKIR